MMTLKYKQKNKTKGREREREENIFFSPSSSIGSPPGTFLVSSWTF
jgi:hypothetical protein